MAAAYLQIIWLLFGHYEVVLHRRIQRRVVRWIYLGIGLLVVALSLALAGRTMRVVRQNLAWAAGYNANKGQLAPELKRSC